MVRDLCPKTSAKRIDSKEAQGSESQEPIRPNPIQRLQEPIGSNPVQGSQKPIGSNPVQRLQEPIRSNLIQGSLEPSKITPSMQIAPRLLRLCWDGYPLH